MSAESVTDVKNEMYKKNLSTEDECSNKENIIDKEMVTESLQDRQAYTYMVECADGSLYTGWTYDLKKRLDSHNSGKGSKYTRSRLPVKLVYFEVKRDKFEAMKREYAIKHMTRENKLKLIGESTN